VKKSIKNISMKGAWTVFRHNKDQKPNGVFYGKFACREILSEFARKIK